MEQSIFYASTEMDTQQIRFSSNNEINTTGGVFAEPLTINKRRACSNGFPNQFLLDTSTTTSAWAPVSSSSGFGGSNTMAAMTASFNSINTSPLLDQQQKPLSRSLESLAIIGAPSTSSDYMMMNGPEMGVDGAMHKDDSRINYSYGCDSGAYNGSLNSAATTANDSFSSGAESFLSTQLSNGYASLVDEESAFNEVIDSFQQCQPFNAQQTDFEMDEC